MRISDWSSDVCSSDLPSAGGCRAGSSAVLPAVQTAVLGAAGDEAGQRLAELRLVEQEGVVAGVAGDLHEADIGGAGIQRMHDAAVLRRREQQIGRASCRERWCQSV